MNSDCIFCKIIRGDVPSFSLYENDATFAFMDINPVNDGHALVVPREHASDLFSLSPDALTATSCTAQRVAKAINNALQPAGMNLLQCNGEAAAQSVLHFHMHVLPREKDDKLPLNWGLSPGNMDSISALAERIRAYL